MVNNPEPIQPMELGRLLDPNSQIFLPTHDYEHS